MHCSWDSQTSFLVKFLLKMGSTALFTHLKIILLQYFQFLVFMYSAISGIQTNHTCVLGMDEICQLILLFSLFLLLFMTPSHFLILFMGLTVLFHLIFTFIYNTFNKKILILVK